MKSTFIAWERYERRSDLLAQHLGASMHHVYYGQRGRWVQVPSRYVKQAAETWKILLRERPELILVQNPPIVVVLIAFLYGWLHKSHYAIDSHTAAFLSPRWRWSVGLHRLLSRHARVTIVHNDSQADIVKEWGCSYCRVGFVPGHYPAGDRFALNGKFNVAMISTSSEDEPLECVLEGVRQMPEVQLYVTGHSGLAIGRMSVTKPDNCHFTGYLPYEKYIGLLRGVDAVMDLTTRDHTLLAGGFEAVSLGTPLIVSDWPILKEYFPLGTVHVSNTAEGIRDGLRRAQRQSKELRQGILLMQEKLQTQWEIELAKLQSILHGC